MIDRVLLDLTRLKAVDILRLFPEALVITGIGRVRREWLAPEVLLRSRGSSRSYCRRSGYRRLHHRPH